MNESRLMYCILIAGCGLDIVFLIDTSGSVGENNFNQMVSTVYNMINMFDLDSGSGPVQTVRGGITIFSDLVHPKKQLNQFELPGIPYDFLNGGTDIAAAIT